MPGEQHRLDRVEDREDAPRRLAVDVRREHGGQRGGEELRRHEEAGRRQGAVRLVVDEHGQRHQGGEVAQVIDDV